MPDDGTVNPTPDAVPDDGPANFIEEIIDEDLASGRYDGVFTRFPPEPNGYLHIGHAKAICLNFSTAAKYGGKTNLRFDDTNPTKEEQKYIDAIIDNIHWLGFEWDNLLYASDYFDQLYAWAVQLIKDGKAYVDHLSQDEIREYRGTLTEPGKNSPYRDRSVEENLDLFERMKNGEFPDGACVLRAKIDMTSPILNLRDPVMYRIMHASHYPRTGRQVVHLPDLRLGARPVRLDRGHHAIRSAPLEFVVHRPLVQLVPGGAGHLTTRSQTEFARLNLYLHGDEQAQAYCRMVEEGHVKRLGRPAHADAGRDAAAAGTQPEAIRDFCGRRSASRKRREYG
jgi:glutaminyl-tRNA synthetase